MQAGPLMWNCSYMLVHILASGSSTCRSYTSHFRISCPKVAVVITSNFKASPMIHAWMEQLILRVEVMLPCDRAFTLLKIIFEISEHKEELSPACSMPPVCRRCPPGLQAGVPQTISHAAVPTLAQRQPQAHKHGPWACSVACGPEHQS